MSSLSGDSGGSVRSDPGPIKHPRRQDVLFFYLDRALTETRLSLEDFSERLAFSYNARVPEHAQSLELLNPDTKGSYQEYARQVGRLRKRVQRYVDGSRHLPVELEECWVSALPQPYSERCKRELVRRYGFLGAVSPSARPCRDEQAVATILTKVGELTGDLAKALEDGRLGPEDFDGSGRLMQRVDDAAAAIASVRARLVEVMPRGGS